MDPREQQSGRFNSAADWHGGKSTRLPKLCSFEQTETNDRGDLKAEFWFIGKKQDVTSGVDEQCYDHMGRYTLHMISKRDLDIFGSQWKSGSKPGIFRDKFCLHNFTVANLILVK